MSGIVLEAQVQALLVEELVLGAHKALDQVDHVGSLDLKLGRAVLEARELEHGVDKARKTARL